MFRQLTWIDNFANQSRVQLVPWTVLNSTRTGRFG